MKLGVFQKIAAAVRRRPIITLRYDVNTALSRAEEETPHTFVRFRIHKRLDPLRTACALLLLWGGVRYLKRKKQK